MKKTFSIGRLIASAALCLASAAPAAQPASPAIWLNAGVLSVHFDRGKDLREGNVGLGAEVAVAPQHVVMAGTFINSNRARSRYAGYAWRPLSWQAGPARIRAGVAAGAFDGYPRYRGGDWFVAALPLLAVEGKRLGANVYLVPTIRDRLDGAIAFQLKVALP